METFHRVEGFAIVGGWGLLLLWGIVLFVIRKDASRPYWWLLTALQVLIVVQLLAGLILFAMGGRPPLLHYFYGVVFPALLLGVAHWLTRSLDKPPYHVFFTIASFFVFGLTLRALMTGLGIG
jgi:heme A synthase